MESIQTKKAFGLRLRTKRKEAHMTQQELAEKLDYSKSFISKVESGINEMPQSKIVLAAEIIGTTPAYLMGWDGGKVHNVDLSQDELNIISLYRSMNKDGRNAAMDMIFGLVQSGRYTEDTRSAVG